MEFKPLLKFLFFSLYLLIQLFNSFKEEKDSSSIIIVPIPKLMGVPQRMLFYTTCELILTMGTQLEFRYNPFNGLNEMRDVVLLMVSGSVQPIRLGLTNEQQIRRLVKVTEFCIKVKDCLQIFGFAVFILNFMIFICLVKSSLKELDDALVILNAFLFSNLVNYVFVILVNTLLTILINYFYFKSKVN